MRRARSGRARGHPRRPATRPNPTRSGRPPAPSPARRPLTHRGGLPSQSKVRCADAGDYRIPPLCPAHLSHSFAPHTGRGAEHAPIAPFPHLPPRLTRRPTLTPRLSPFSGRPPSVDPLPTTQYSSNAPPRLKCCGFLLATNIHDPPLAPPISHPYPDHLPRRPSPAVPGKLAIAAEWAKILGAKHMTRLDCALRFAPNAL
jgi:hypothetical protein